MSTRSGTPRGFTILEATIAMAILLVGLVGMLQFLIHSARSDRLAREQTLAAKAAAELLNGLNGLAWADPRLQPNATGNARPAVFGRLLSGTGSPPASGFHEWSDANPIPGVRTKAQLDAGPERSLALERRWVVWEYELPGVTSTVVRVISVSVVYTDLYSQEVVLYGQRTNLGALLVQGIFAG